jgi:hypothetical protein
MMGWDSIALIALPVVGWALSVEQRLTGRAEIQAAIKDVKKDVAKLSDRQEELIDFLLRNHGGPHKG